MSMDQSIPRRALGAGIFGKRKLVLLVFVLLAAASLWSLYEQGGRTVPSVREGKTVDSTELASVSARDADIYGMIVSVEGNRITVLKFDPSTMPGAKQSQAQATETQSENAISLGTTSGIPGAPSGMPSGMPGERGGFGGSGSTTRSAKLEELKKISIGTATITVPIGIPIAVSAEGGMEAGTLKDLTSDTVVVLWIGDASTQTAEYVQVTGTVDMTGNAQISKSN